MDDDEAGVAVERDRGSVGNQPQRTLDLHPRQPIFARQLAPCETGPPVSRTMPLMIMKTGVQPGSVEFDDQDVTFADRADLGEFPRTVPVTLPTLVTLPRSTPSPCGTGVSRSTG